MMLIINPGSSSLKYKLYDRQLSVLADNNFSDIGHKIKNHAKAVEMMFAEIKKYLSEIEKVGYRVVHGGDEVSGPLPITLPTMKIIEKYFALAPHHNPPAYDVIHSSIGKFAFSQHFAVFDTAYFVDLPQKTKIYPISRRVSEDYGIKRFGFHGISHEYVVGQVDPEKSKKVISVHLGAGCSLAAINEGRPVDTSMGFTPLEGIPMKTRPGDLDPSIVLFLVEKLGLKKTRDVIENHSGLAGLTETSGSMLSVLHLAGEKIEDENFVPEKSDLNCSKEDAELAIDIFTYRIKKYIGSYAASLGGVDTLVFTGQIGSGSSVIREKIIEGLEYLNFDLEIIKADEELAIAQKLSSGL